MPYPYGGIGFEHVWRFQIGCMMSNQYSALVEAINANSSDKVIISCLRLAWNDAFKHVSENQKAYEALSDADKNKAVQKACRDLVEYFKEYAKASTTKDRYDLIDKWIGSGELVPIFLPIKVTSSLKYTLCLGHIQKIFNVAMKLLLCLIISAEYAAANSIRVELGKIGGTSVYLNDHALLSYANFPYAFDTADCPVDHYIL